MIALDPVLQIARFAEEKDTQLELALARSLTEQGVRHTGGPLIDETTTHRRLAKEQAQREAATKDAELKDLKRKSIVELQ